jgi:hypothetical protein
MYQIVIAFKDSADNFAVGGFASYAAAAAAADTYRLQACKLFSIPCLVAVRLWAQ